MSEDKELSCAGTAVWPNVQGESERAMVRIFKMGMLCAAFKLRAADFLSVPDKHLDLMADLIEGTAASMRTIPNFPIPGNFEMEANNE